MQGKKVKDRHRTDGGQAERLEERAADTGVEDVQEETGDRPTAATILSGLDQVESLGWPLQGDWEVSASHSAGSRRGWAVDPRP